MPHPKQRPSTRSQSTRPKAADNSLGEYRAKRSFERTPEPKGRRPRRGKFPIFVIQKHDATRLHYDFRLEVNGVLKSWAVPKGPSTDPADKRLAMPTEDHPMEYAEFEGVIPEGEYGAGPVIVWDAGLYLNLKEQRSHPETMEESLEKGHATVWLAGRKLKGGYALIRAGKPTDRERWLFIKMDDEEADPSRNPVADEPRSVLSGLTLEEMALRGHMRPRRSSRDE